MANDAQGVPLINRSGIVHPHLTPEGRGISIEKWDGVLTQRLPTIDPPPDSWTFLPNGAVQIPAVGQSITVCSQTIPKGRSAVIWKIANGTALGGGISGWSNGDETLIWKMLRNGVPFQYFNNIVTVIGLVEQGGSSLVAPLYCRENDNISLVVFNIGVPFAQQITVGSFSGYTYPKALDPRKMR